MMEYGQGMPVDSAATISCIRLRVSLGTRSAEHAYLVDWEEGLEGTLCLLWQQAFQNASNCKAAG